MGRLSIAILPLVVLLTSSSIMGCTLFEDAALRHLGEGNELRKQGCLDEAIEKYTEAIRSKPMWWEPYYNRGIAYCDLGQNERGIEDFTEAIRLNPGYSDLYYSRGVANAEQGKKAEAIADFVKFISLNGINSPQWIEMAEQQIEELSR